MSQPENEAKAPYYIHLNDQAVFGFAGLWDRSVNDSSLMVAYEVSGRVNTPKNNDPTQIEPSFARHAP